MLTILFALTASASTCPNLPVPGESWTDRRSEVAEGAATEIDALEAYAFPGNLDEETREGVRTDGLIIVRDGAVLYERYGRGWTADQPHLLWSASKNIAGSLTGMAVKQGKLDLDAPICDYVDVTNPDACAITSRHLLEFSSGLAWRESYEGESPRVSSVISMLFGDGREDMLAFVTGHELRDPPGTSYDYSSGDTVVLSAVVDKVMEAQHGPRYPHTQLFEPLGITSAVVETDAMGVPIGSSYIYMTPRDMARYGTFLLHDGCWDGERMLPEGWVGRTAELADSLHGRVVQWSGGGNPGWNAWVNLPAEHLGETEPPWKGAPVDTFAALGHWKQSIYVVPSENLVIARVADDRDGESYQHGELIRLAIAVANAVTDEPSTPDVPASGEAGGVSAGGESEPAGVSEPEPPADPVQRWRLADKPAAAEGTPFVELPGKYDLGLFKIASGFAARQACSCLFVSERTEAQCRAYIKVSPDVARIKIDWDDKSVKAKSLGMGKVVARHLGAEEGCRVVDK